MHFSFDNCSVSKLVFSTSSILELPTCRLCHTLYVIMLFIGLLVSWLSNVILCLHVQGIWLFFRTLVFFTYLSHCCIYFKKSLVLTDMAFDKEIFFLCNHGCLRKKWKQIYFIMYTILNVDRDIIIITYELNSDHMNNILVIYNDNEVWAWKNIMRKGRSKIKCIHWMRNDNKI